MYIIISFYLILKKATQKDTPVSTSHRIYKILILHLFCPAQLSAKNSELSKIWAGKVSHIIEMIHQI